MKPAAFAYCRAEQLEDALETLHAHADDARLLAGGQSLVPLLNLRLARPGLIVDIDRLPGLGDLKERAGKLAIGALARYADIEVSPLAARGLPLLVEAIRHVGHQAIRNRGTVGGSLAHADPASELGCVLVTTGGTVHVSNHSGTRSIEARSFFRDYFRTALDATEMITEVELPLAQPGAGAAFEELSRRHGDFALAMAAAQVQVDAMGSIVDVAVGLGAVGPTPLRAEAAEQLLLGERPTPALLAAASSVIASAAEPQSDVHCTAEDRRHLAGVLGRRVIERALARARVSV